MHRMGKRQGTGKTELQLETYPCGQAVQNQQFSPSPREERVGRGPGRGENSSGLLSPALSFFVPQEERSKLSSASDEEFCLTPIDVRRILKSTTIWRLESRQNPHAGKRALHNAAFPGCMCLAYSPSFSLSPRGTS